MSWSCLACVKSEYVGFRYFVLGPDACDDKQRKDGFEEYLTIEREPASIVTDYRIGSGEDKVKIDSMPSDTIFST